MTSARRSAPDSILVATSLVAGSSDLLRSAHAVARSLGARLDLLFAVSAGHLGTSEEVLVGVEHAARERFRRLIARLGIAPTDLGETIVRRGRAAEVILEEAERRRAALVVMRGSDRGRRLGSTTDRVLRGADVPVLVVRGRLLAVRRTLFAVQLDAVAEHVLRRGFEIASALAGGKRARHEALTVVPGLHIDLSYGDSAAHVRDELARARADLAALIARAAPGVRFHQRVVHGYPWLEILGRVRSGRPDLVVLGTHGEHGLRRLLMGSVAADLVRSAPCSALVIPPPAARE